jgi:uncharacterized membrane protein
VRLGFQRRPWDLYLAVGYTLLTSAGLLAVGGGNLVGILLVLFVPGYVLVALLFPNNTEVGWIERIVLSFGLSFAVAPLLGLFLSFTPWGIRFAPIITAIAVFTATLGSGAYLRRMQLPVDQRLSFTVELGMPDLKEYSVLEKRVIVVFSLGIVIALGTSTYVAFTPRPAVTYTDFYILGPGGNTSDYPTKLLVNQTGNLILGLTNHEGTTVNYTVRVDLIGVAIVHDPGSGFNKTIEVNRTTWTWINKTVVVGASWTQAYGFSIESPGLWKVHFLLFKGGDFSSSYRQAQLFVTVA